MTDALRKLVDSHHKILFVGIGNVFKHDDGIGVYVCQKLLSKGYDNCVIVEQSIENYLGYINKINPDLVVFIDAVNFNQKPGFTSLLPLVDLVDQTSNTHNISLSKMANLIYQPVMVLGIQPADVSFGEGFTPIVKESANQIIAAIAPNSAVNLQSD